ncbi:XRE family transcriptional regulator [uncultured Cohaesibacter sp.]|uniref:helix-turn-helix domain-containing protein n=1 Tax=uncultured Cohaesibacter sp. TaxID=1002546 RepID=UPI002930AAA4|nr:XRE family transcriptional regulator [uncultured Cohaesibacter sp.]
MQNSDRSSQQSSVMPSLGDRLRTRRKELRLTLKDVAKSASFSTGFISQIERGITVPSLTSLVAVCRVLQLDVGEFFQSPDEKVATVTRHNERTRYTLDGSPGHSVSYERLSAPVPGNILRSTLIHEPPGFRSEPMSHEGEEIFYIVEGELTLEIEGETNILEQGDTAHFLSNRVHSTWNHTTEPTIVFHTCTMDVFGDEEKSITENASVAIARARNRKRKKDRLEPTEK